VLDRHRALAPVVDPLIPLITTVPVSGTAADARAFIARQHDRLATGAGYSFAIADAAAGEAPRAVSRARAASVSSTTIWLMTSVDCSPRMPRAQAV
jgi:hypothetical protein